MTAVNKRRQQVAGDVVNNRRTNRRQVLRQTRRGRRQRDRPGLVRAKRHQAGQRPGRNRRGAGRVRRRIGIAARQQILIHRLRHRSPAVCDRNVVLDTDDEAAGQRDEVAVRVGRNKDRRQVDGDQRLVVVVRAQPVVELVQQRERVRARRRW